MRDRDAASASATAAVDKVRAELQARRDTSIFGLNWSEHPPLQITTVEDLKKEQTGEPEKFLAKPKIVRGGLSCFRTQRS